MKFFVAVFLVLLSSCSVVKNITHEKANTPPPTQDLYSFGSHYTARGATQVATEAAQAFCYKWRMSPAVRNKQTAERGVLPDTALEEIRLNPEIPTWTPSKAKWETRLIYTCL